MTRYVCVGVGCKAEWEIRDGNPDRMPNATLCRPCEIEAYRDLQRRQGNFDCFAKAHDFCDQEKCTYKKLCFA